MTIFVIALLHAVPVFVIAVWTKSKFALVFTAVIAGMFGVVTGNPAYIAADLIGVAIAFALGVFFINQQRSSPAPQVDQPKPAPEEKHDDSSWVSGIIIVVFIAVFLYNKATDKPLASPAHVQQQTSAPFKQVQSKPVDRPLETKPYGAESRNRGNSDLRHCLNLPTDAAIMRCANQGR